MVRERGGGRRARRGRGIEGGREEGQGEKGKGRERSGEKGKERERGRERSRRKQVIRAGDLDAVQSANTCI